MAAGGGPWVRTLVSWRLPQRKARRADQGRACGPLPSPSPVQASQNWLSVPWNAGGFAERERREGGRETERRMDRESGEESRIAGGKNRAALLKLLRLQGSEAGHPRG